MISASSLTGDLTQEVGAEWPLCRCT